MLETLDLTLKLAKDEYRKRMDRLGKELQWLQHRAYEEGIPLTLIFEGWDAAGKGDSIGHLLQNMDPRGFKVFVTRQRSEEERLRPLLWRFWLRLPGRGAISIFDRSWYFWLCNDRLRGTLDKQGWEQGLEEADDFERQLADEGMVLRKFWLHIGKKEQKRRLKAWAKDPYQQWRVQLREEESFRKYEPYLKLVEEMLSRTHTHLAPWILVEAENDLYRRIKVLSEVAGALREAFVARGIEVPTVEEIIADGKPVAKSRRRVGADPLKKAPVIPPDSPLARIDVAASLDPKDYAGQLEAAQNRLRELMFQCYVQRRAVVIAFEGWDAAGKGGAIKRLTQRIDPRGYTVLPVAAPRPDEKERHYLWRFWRDIPKDGHMAIFDRSWYGRVLVERVEGFCTREQWRRAYQEINEFERALASHGVVLVKFWLHITPEEQLDRFRRREQIPGKHHKITDEDWRNRARWPEYLEAVSDMVRQTSTPHAPWTLVEANDKYWARVKVCKTVMAALEKALGNKPNAKPKPAGRGGEKKGTERTKGT